MREGDVGIESERGREKAKDGRDERQEMSEGDIDKRRKGEIRVFHYRNCPCRTLLGVK